ncbi:hypothetical protein K9M78_05450 [Candidatus Bipolaricaulota bacterium]|nr:hypothetical protein [Candidatus Bipolaricaulota bacterium]
MGIFFGSIFTFLVAIFGIVFGFLGLLIGAVLSIAEFLLAGPVIIIMVILGLILWHPFLWIVLFAGIFYLYRINKKRRYIKIRRG